MYNSGGSREGALPPPAPFPLFLDQTEARRAEKKIETPTPLSQGLDDRPLPPYLKV